MLTLVLNAGHAEYPPPAVEGLEVDTLYENEWNEEASDEQHINAICHFAAVKGVEFQAQELIDSGDLDPQWEVLLIVRGEREAHKASLTRLMHELSEPPTGDDTTYDYWPSGVRMADQWAAALDDNTFTLFRTELAAVVREVLDVKEMSADEVNLGGVLIEVDG
jgi:hypothetical protein